MSTHSRLQTRPIARIHKNGREELWLALDKWTDPNGGQHDVINARLFVKHRDAIRPTANGKHRCSYLGRCERAVAALKSQLALFRVRLRSTESTIAVSTTGRVSGFGAASSLFKSTGSVSVSAFFCIIASASGVVCS